MAEEKNATAALHSLKRAANYSKLAFHEFGPRSYKRGQGALLKVIAKFGENNKLNKKTAEKILDWRGNELRHIARKAEHNEYITIEDPEYQFTMTLTPKGLDVVQKRLDVENRTADAILGGLTPEEVAKLAELTDKISKTCEGLGVDYSVIKERKGSKKCCKKHHHHADGCHHGHRGHHDHHSGKCHHHKKH